jgi:hypothetical protein
MEGGRGIEIQGCPHPVGDERIETCPFVRLVEMGDRLASEQLNAICVADWRTIGVIQQCFSQVRGWRHVFEPLLVLDAHRIQAESARHPRRGDIHFALLQHLVISPNCGELEASVQRRYKVVTETTSVLNACHPSRRRSPCLQSGLAPSAAEGLLH